jgi:PAS domain S-box-containing protein
MPLWDDRAIFRGLVAMNINLESLSFTLKKIANEYKPEEEFQVVIIDSTGQVIAHPFSDKLLTNMPKSQSEIVNAVLLGKASNIVEKDDNGREILYSFVPITSSGWGVIVSRPTEKAFASSQAFYQGVILILIFFVIVGILYWIGLNRLAITPLRHLVDFSQAISRGQFISNHQNELLESLSHRTDQVGNLTNSLVRMEQAINARLNELSILLQTSTYILSSIDTQTVLGRILDQVDELFSVEMSAIFALDEHKGVFKIQASHGFSQEYIDSLGNSPSAPQSIISRAIHYRTPIQVSHKENDSQSVNLQTNVPVDGFQSILAIPLNTHHTPPSALLILRQDPHIFSEQEITLLSNFANHAAMAIENAALYARSDTRLQIQTRRLESLIQSLNDGLILGNLEGRILYANRSICELANLHHEDVIGSTIADFVESLLAFSDDYYKAKESINCAIDKTGENVAEFSLKHNGEERHIRLRVFNVTDSRNFPIGYGQIFQDITADYELDRLKSSLISTVSHELRTPLATIKGYTTTLLAEDVIWNLKSQKEFLQIISDETDRLSALVTDLLDLSRIEAGDIVVSRSKCDFLALVKRAAMRASPKPGNRLYLDFSPDMPNFYLDTRRIEVVMRNLIENATKYADPYSPINISAVIQNGNLLVKVEDQGPGIPTEEGNRIFDSFYRLHKDLDRTESGFGLGLSICQGFIRAHGGEIWIETLETGACIAFSLPIQTSI